MRTSQLQRRDGAIVAADLRNALEPRPGSQFCRGRAVMPEGMGERPDPTKLLLKLLLRELDLLGLLRVSETLEIGVSPTMIAKGNAGSAHLEDLAHVR